MNPAILLIGLICLGLASKAVTATDAEMLTPYTGDDETVLIDDWQHFLIGTSPDTYNGSEEPTVTNTSGGGTTTTYAKYYDVILALKDRAVRPGDRISAVLNLDFVPPFPPERDGIIEYLLLDDQGKALQSVIRVVKEGDQAEEISYVVPSTAKGGQWTFRAIWTVKDLEPMTAEEVFHVEKQNSKTGIIAAALLGTVIIGAGAAYAIGGKK